MTENGKTTSEKLDVKAIRKDFPALDQLVHGHPLVYLDNAATTQKPRAVIEETSRFYREDNANIHRGLHLLSERATAAYDRVREKVRHLVNAASANEIVFTRGATESINLVAATWGRSNVRAGDEIVVSALEHHSNIVPWQMLCEEKGARLRVIPMTDEGELRVDELPALLGGRTRLVAVTQVSNALGTATALEEIVKAARAVGARVLVDGAQGICHLGVDVQALGADFYVFSAHKMYGPSGVGVLWGREALLNAMPPYQGGGDMIVHVTFEETLFKKAPERFEAGTPNIAGVVGFGAAIDYLSALGMERIAAHETDLLEYGTRVLSRIQGLQLVGTAKRKAAVLSFTLEGIHPHDIGTLLDRQGVAIRAGHHCAQPVMDRLGIPATARASLAVYNTRTDLDALAAGLEEVKRVFG
jgi:cysteine desulfurase/selenocysteine lyase